MRRRAGGVVTVLSLLLLSGCGTPTKQDLIAKANGIKKKDKLRDALGKPDDLQMMDVPMLGSTETWTYKCSDGEVVFQFWNDKIVMKATGSDEKRR